MRRAAFRTPGFALLYGGLAASMLGDSLMLIVLSLWVKTLTHSNGAAGLTFLWLTLPALVAPVFGYVVDKFPRRPFLVVANLLSAVAVLPLLLVHDAGDVWIIYAVAFLYGVSFVVVPAALNGLLKDLLPAEVLVDANAIAGGHPRRVPAGRPARGCGVVRVGRGLLRRAAGRGQLRRRCPGHRADRRRLAG